MAIKPGREAAICECGGHGFVALTRSRVALFDVDDLPVVAGRMWSALLSRKKTRQTYAVRGTEIGGVQKMIYMHREILNPSPGKLVDHRGHDGTDNRRYNLREADDTQNSANGRPKGGTSRFKGVSWSKDRALWAATIKCRGDHQFLGRFRSEEDAARAYDEAATRLFGEFAATNQALGLFTGETE